MCEGKPTIGIPSSILHKNIKSFFMLKQEKTDIIQDCKSCKSKNTVYIKTELYTNDKNLFRIIYKCKLCMKEWKIEHKPNCPNCDTNNVGIIRNIKSTKKYKSQIVAVEYKCTVCNEKIRVNISILPIKEIGMELFVDFYYGTPIKILEEKTKYGARTIYSWMKRTFENFDSIPESHAIIRIHFEDKSISSWEKFLEHRKENRKQKKWKQRIHHYH